MLDAVQETPDARSRATARRDLGPAALELIERHGPEILRTARRYSRTAEDAEDAYQRGLEILLTKAPSTDEDELVPWLKTVVKHEALSLQRQREQHGAGTDEALEWAPAPVTTDEQVEQRERFLIGAEALANLKTNEVRCLLLLADGMTYRQIAEAQGWSYTKVNRLATEGRRAFRDGVARIESGDECGQMASKLCALADGEAAADDMPELRRHLRGCRACRLTLGEYRATPARVAALAPPLVAVAGSDPGGGLGGLLSSASDWVQERTYGLVLKVQALTEAATAHKTAAVAASTAVLAGGGVGAVKSLESRGPDDQRSAPAESEPRRARAKPPVRLKPPATLERPSADASRREGGESRRTSRRSTQSNSAAADRRSAAPQQGASRESSAAPQPEFSGAETYSTRTSSPRKSSASSASSSSSSSSSSARGNEFGGRVESGQPSAGPSASGAETE